MSTNYVILGGTSGIGKAIVERILEDCKDAFVVASYGHSDDLAKKFRKELPKDQSDRLAFIKTDMSKRDSIDLFLEQISQRFSSENMINYLILNIGVGNYKPFDEYQFEDWDRVMETNLTIPIFLIQRIKNSGLLAHGASILLMSSHMGTVPHSSSLVYSISKAGLSFASKLLVKEFEPYGIRINALAPGFIETRWQNNRTDDSRSRINAKIALHRFGSSMEVADAAVFLLENTYMNGSVVTIDGGYNYF